MKRLTPWLALALLATQAAHAEDSMRCGSRLASERRLEVPGAPALRRAHGQVSVVGSMPEPRVWFHEFRYYYLDPPYQYVPVEVWTYNFGPNKLLRCFASRATSWSRSEPMDYGY